VSTEVLILREALNKSNSVILSEVNFREAKIYVAKNRLHIATILRYVHPPFGRMNSAQDDVKYVIRVSLILSMFFNPIYCSHNRSE
jgi:hypothetical protein